MLLDHLLLLATFLAPSIGSALPDTNYPQRRNLINSILGQTSCPAVWSEIAAELKAAYADCNNGARSAIRFAFHDAAGFSFVTTPYGAATGGADGSLLLNDTEIARSDNDPLQTFRSNLLASYNSYKDRGVGAADFVQFAGVMGSASCPNGPIYKTVIGRSDDSTACPEGMLPQAFGANSSAIYLVNLWAAKGFTPRELAALLGAHSVSQAFVQQANGIPAGGPQDSTFTKWDTNYFRETQKGPKEGVYSFDSDVNLSRPGTLSGTAFTEFGNNFYIWSEAFKAAMYKLSILGVPATKVAQFIDCTDVITDVM